MRKIRCSYGTFGVAYEATLKVRPLTPVEVYHKTYDLDDFLAALPELIRSGRSIFYYMFPFTNKITVEFRRYNPDAQGKPDSRSWRRRNLGWSVLGPVLGRWIEAYVPGRALRGSLIDAGNAYWRFELENRVKHPHTIGVDQTIRYPPTGGRSKYTFSLFAFPVDEYPKVIKEFYRFCQDYYRRTGYRSNLLYVGYYIIKDQNSVLSYSFDSDVMTLDPVSTANPGWREYLTEYNQFCSDRNGVPLLNQTWGVTRKIAEIAYGERLDIMAEARQMYDPDGRLLNDYFRELFALRTSTATP